MSNSVMQMLERHLGSDWDARLIDPSIWNRVLAGLETSLQALAAD